MDLYFDFEHSKIFDTIPTILILGSMFAGMFLPVPNNYRLPIMCGGVVLGMILMGGLELSARVNATENLVLKSRIDGWDEEKEFHCYNPPGAYDSEYNPSTKTYTTHWKLAVPVKLPLLGPESNILTHHINIKHTLPWATRNKPGKKLWVHWNGIEVKSSNAVMVTLIPSKKPASMNNEGEFIAEFLLFRGNQDSDLRKNRPLIELEANEELT